MMNLRLLFPTAGLLAVLGMLSAQPVNLDHLKGIKIRNIGPAGMSGRVTAIDAVVDNPDIIYVGAASGGVWKSVSGGIDWEPVFDDQPVQSIGAIAINQRTPDVVWVGTGEGNPRNSQNSGMGIFRSLDGGRSWECMGLEETKVIHRILIHPDNPEVLYVAALGSPWGPNEERGVYHTTDGGKSWEKILYVNDQTGCADLVMDPTNPNKLIAAMWEYGRKPWTFNSGGPGSGLYVTYDGGKTWKERTSKDGLPEGDLGRIGLAIAPSKPSIVYALVEAKENALYKSTDGGKTFRKHSTDEDAGNRPFYYSDIFVDPSNENRIYSLYSYVSKSEDGGKTFDVLLAYPQGVHPDHHAMWIHPGDPSLIMEGNDGGFYLSRDGGDSWQFAENLPVGQFYHVNYDMDIPYNIGGGMQDNGSWVGRAYVWESGGVRNANWREIFFGDGFDVGFKPGDSRYAYAMSQGGNLGMVDRHTGKTKFIRPVHPDGETELRFNWNAAFAQSPHDACTIYYGSQFLHKSTDCGDSWTIISPDLTTNDTTKQQQDKSGGLTIDDTQAENFTTILAIAPSPVDENIIWVGTDDGNLQLTRDGGQSWTNLAGHLPGVKAGSWIPFIEVSQHNSGEAFVIVNDYRRNDWQPMAFHTTDFGQSWTRIVDETQASGPALAIVQDPEEPNLLFLGTDHGLYFSIDGARTWNKWTKGYPSVPTADLKIHPREHDLIIATFGRSFWILDDIRPLRELAATQAKVLDEPFAAFEAPDAYLAEYKSYQGTRFSADAIYSGDNRPYGALLTLWINPKWEMGNGNSEETTGEETEPADEPAPNGNGNGNGQGEKKRPERVQVQVIDSAGDTIRTFRSRVDTGMVRITWNLRRDGVRTPSRRGPRPDADPPTGPEVLPGAYKLVVTYGEYKDSTEVTVHTDPRLEVTKEDLLAKEKVYEEYEALVDKAREGFDRLKDARKTIKLVDEALVNAPDSTKKAVAKQGKDLSKRIAKLEKLYMQPEGLKGIQRWSDNLSYTIRSARGYVSALDGPPNQAANIAMDRLRTETAEVLDEVNAFLEEDFAEYRQKVEEVEFSLFKGFEPVKMD
jgi:photosystem II stability/assembly factor-like uncharacterized protein